MSEYNVGDEVVTDDGKGKIVEVEIHTSKWSKNETAERRYGVELADNPYGFSPVFYWKKEFKHES